MEKSTAEATTEITLPLLDNNNTGPVMETSAIFVHNYGEFIKPYFVTAQEINQQLNNPRIEDLLQVNCDNLSDVENDLKAAIRPEHTVLIPNQLNTSEYLEHLCNSGSRLNESSYVLDTTYESPKSDNLICSQKSDISEVISDQDVRCREQLIQLKRPEISPLANGTIVTEGLTLNHENSSNAVFEQINNESSAQNESINESNLTFNGKIPGSQTVEESGIGTSDSSLVKTESSFVSEAGTNDHRRFTDSFQEYSNERSPELFNDDYEDEEPSSPCRHSFANVQKEADQTDERAAIIRNRDNFLLKRLQAAFSGVLPPPSVTDVEVTVDMIVTKYKEYENKENHIPGKESSEIKTTAFKSTDPIEKAINGEWPEMRNLSCFDVCYNLSNAIENYDYLTVKYTSRFITSETSSSFVATSPSSSKKRQMRTKAIQKSPGRRLSHLARRKAIFSCANLQNSKDTQSSNDISKVSKRQILLVPRNRKQMKIKTPKRKTPGRGKTPKKKTPSSSAKKRLVFGRQEPIPKPSLTRETSKRVLFQSPSTSSAGMSSQQRPKISADLASRVDKSKRALFSSPKFGRYSTFSFAGSSSSENNGLETRFTSMTNLTTNFDGGSKRRREDDSDGEDENENCKMLRANSPVRPATSKQFARSQSFTVDQLSRQKSIGLHRTHSEIIIPTPSSTTSSQKLLALTDAEKQKLLWIVSQTLLRNQIGGKHEKFKEYATVMAKVIKRLYLESSRKGMESVSEQMNKLANRIAFSVIQGKTELEIYSAERLKAQAMNRANSKLNGYITSEEYELYKNNGRVRRPSSSVFSENSMSFSQCSFISAGQKENYSQNTLASQNSMTKAYHEPGNVLKEHVDNEQRPRITSSHKNVTFSGKDQKNVSPFSGDSSKHKLLVGGKNAASLLKAKRQISFDA